MLVSVTTDNNIDGSDKLRSYVEELVDDVLGRFQRPNHAQSRCTWPMKTAALNRATKTSDARWRREFPA